MKPAWICILLFHYSFAIKWLSLHSIKNIWTEPNHCPKQQHERKAFGLVGYQARMCRRISELMPVIIRAAESTVSACQNVFASHRWNCSSVLLAPDLKADLVNGTKEQAYVYALSSAAITHHAAKACMSGDLPYCPCGFDSLSESTETSYNTLQWKGCSDNVVYGQRVSKEWADAQWRKKPKDKRNDTAVRRFYRRLIDDLVFTNSDYLMQMAGKLPIRVRMNQHNNEVGRQITEESLIKKCKCHGVSSSCNVKTCWNTLPELTNIAHKLKRKYAEAVVAFESTTKSLIDNTNHSGEISRENLVYIRKSPNYCDEDKGTGSFGTTMRECNVSSTGSDGCESLCCGRGYNIKQVLIEEQCKCKYVHCCYVKCETCSYLVDKYYCK